MTVMEPPQAGPRLGPNLSDLTVLERNILGDPAVFFSGSLW